MRSWTRSLHPLAALAARARIPQHQSCRAASLRAASTNSAPKDRSNVASIANVKIQELRRLARPLGLPDPPRTMPLTEEEKLAKYLNPQKRLEEREHLCVVDLSHEFTSSIEHFQLSITFLNFVLDIRVGLSFTFWDVVSCLIG